MIWLAPMWTVIRSDKPVLICRRACLLRLPEKIATAALLNQVVRAAELM